MRPSAPPCGLSGNFAGRRCICAIIPMPPRRAGPARPSGAASGSLDSELCWVSWSCASLTRYGLLRHGGCQWLGVHACGKYTASQDLAERPAHAQHLEDSPAVVLRDVAQAAQADVLHFTELF